jgi:hypothetical protein
MTTESERRRGLRQPVCLPVKILFLGHRAAHGSASTSMRAAPVAPSSARMPVAARAASSSSPAETAKPEASPSVVEDTPLHAVAIDASAQGFQIEISGLAVRRLREDPDMMPRLEVRFSHDGLRPYGARIGRVRWSRQEGRAIWRVGLHLDTPLEPETLQAILAIGQPGKMTGRFFRDMVCGAIAAAIASVLWLRAYWSESEAHEVAQAARLAAEGAVERARDDALACRAERAAEPQVGDAARGGAIPTVAPGDLADAGRRDEIARVIERAFYGVDGGSDRPDAD